MKLRMPPRPPGWLWILFGVLALVAVGAPYLPAGVFRARVERSLEASLNRKVQIGDVRFTFFPSGVLPGPGFVAENVTIHEDPRAGIEPFSRIDELGVSMEVPSLALGRLRVASLDLGTSSINLVKTEGGEWSFQYLLDRASQSGETSQDVPAIRMRGGRINFKFQDTKSPFFFGDADLDVRRSGDGSLDIRFEGNPSRSDHTAQDFGRFFARGTSRPDKNGSRTLDLSVELNQSSLEETLRLMDPQGFGVHGQIALEARMQGSPTDLQVQGNLRINDIHRWDLLPTNGSAWLMNYAGALNLSSEHLELHSVDASSPQAGPAPPFGVRFEAWDMLKAPRWEAGAEINDVPLATLYEIGRHMGASIEPNLAVAGMVSGSATYSQSKGFSGTLNLRQASLTLPDQEPLEAPEAQVVITPQALELQPATVQVTAQMQTAEVTGRFDLASRARNLRIATKGLSVGAMRSFGLASIPVLEQTPRGLWSGWAAYDNGLWTSVSQLRDARLAIDGIADPVNIVSASVRLDNASLDPELVNRGSIQISRMDGTAGALKFGGSYEWKQAAKPVHKFNLTFDQVDGKELERLLAPALLRETGFLARTLGIGTSTAPRWLRDRQADGTVQIAELILPAPPQFSADSPASKELDKSDAKAEPATPIVEKADAKSAKAEIKAAPKSDLKLEAARTWRVRGIRAHVAWDGTSVQLERLTGQLANATLPTTGVTTLLGDLGIDLTGATPRFHYDGELTGVPYKAGTIDLRGTLDAQGFGQDFFDSARADASFTGRALQLSPDTVFPLTSGDLSIGDPAAGPRWKIVNLVVTRFGLSTLGSAASDASGQWVIDLGEAGGEPILSPLLARAPIP